MILALVGGVAFAQIEATASGTATVSWGIDLGTGGAVNVAHGFNNTSSLKIMIPFFGEKTFTGGSADKADVWVEFAFTGDVGGASTNGESTSATVDVAKLHFYGAYIDVLQPSFAAKKAIGWAPIYKGRGSRAGWFNPAFKGFGTTIGYANKDLMRLDVALKLGSDGNWENKGSDGTTPTNGHYGIGFDFAMTPVEKYLSLSATVNAVFQSAYATNPSTKNLNFGIGISSTPIEGLTIKAGFDGAAVNGFAWDAGLSAKYKWVEAALYFNDGFNMSAHFAFNSKGDIVKNLDFGAVVNAYNLIPPFATPTVALGMGANVAYKVAITDAMSVKPYANLWGETNGVTAFDLAYKLGAIFIPMEKVEVEAAWEHGKLNANKYEGGFITGEKMIADHVGSHMGKFVLSLTLKY